MEKPRKHNTRKGKETTVRLQSEWAFIAEALKNISCGSIEEFYINHDIPKTTFYDAVNKFENMKRAFEIAKERIGVRKEKLCEERNLGMNTVTARLLPQYLDRWKKDIEWHSKLKNQEEENKQKVVVIDRFKSHDEKE